MLTRLRSRVYPRVCGGTVVVPTVTMSFIGLSPRVRGNRDYSDKHIPCAGSIPACAGGTRSARRTRSTPYGLSPRVRGTVTLDASTPGATGLSPRVRGNLLHHFFCLLVVRSIPRVRGNPDVILEGIRVGEVYPRVCGGTEPAVLTRRMRGGLSPRVRGNPNYRMDGGVIVRSIPAVRGNPSAARRTSPLLWSIPACAGEPEWGGMFGPDESVYPRVCGGTDIRVCPLSSCKGLSPRVRGNRWSNRGLYQRWGLFPACAGEPTAVFKGDWQAAVYPRVCGGTIPGFQKKISLPGLSPRVRGNHTITDSALQTAGSIPACAGEPSYKAQRYYD